MFASQRNAPPAIRRHFCAGASAWYVLFFHVFFVLLARNPPKRWDQATGRSLPLEAPAESKNARSLCESIAWQNGRAMSPFLLPTFWDMDSLEL